MTEFAKLVISVDSRQVKNADGDLGKLTQTAGKTEAATDQLTGAFRRLAGPLAAIISAREIAQAAESYTNLTNRLRLVTDSTEQLVAAQDSVFQIAQNSRQPLDATAELYQRLATNAKELGLSVAGVEGIVETVSKTLALSGTTAEGSAAALVQLGQAFAAGSLRGDELNSVLEQAPALAKALADGLGVTVGELRKLGADGALSSENLVQALMKQGDAVDSAFGKLQTTGGQAFTVLGNSLTRLVGQLNEASGAGTLFGDTIIGVADYIDSGALTDGIVEAFNVWSQTFAAASADLEGLGTDFGALEAAGSETASFLADAFIQMPANIKAAVQIATVEVTGFFDRVARRAAGAAAEITAYIKGGSEAAARVAKVAADDLARVDGVRQDSIDSILAERDAILNAAAARREQAAADRKKREADRAARQEELRNLRNGLQGRTINLDGAGKADKAAKEAERAAKRIQDLFNSNELNLQRQIALFGQASESAKVMYETQFGDLSKLNEAQKERLVGLAKEIDRMNERKELQDQVRQIEESTWTDAQKSAAEYQAKIEALWQAKQKLNMSDEEYERRVNDVTEAWKRQGDEAKKSQDTFDEFTKNFIENVQGELADTLENGFSGSFDDIAQSWGNLLKRMIAEAVAADLMKRVFGEAGGGEKGATGLIGTLGSSLKNFSFSGIFDSFAGLFDRGGNIPAGGWGIVGEKGPELVRGPASVTGREDTAKALGAGGVTIGQLVLPGVTNAREGRESAAAFGKRVNSIVSGARRYG